MARMLEAELGSKVASNNHALRFKEKAGESDVALRQAIDRLRARGAPTPDDCLKFAMGEQPKRFSKFDPCLPEDLLSRLVVESSLDVPSAQKVLSTALVASTQAGPATNESSPSE